MNQLYRIEEFFTNGWELIDPQSQKLTKEECKKQLEGYLTQGYNPNHLRVVLDDHDS